MNFDYDFPDITAQVRKTGAYKKPRRVGDLRLGDSLRNLNKRFSLSSARRDEDRNLDYYTVSSEKKTALFDTETSALGCGIAKDKVWALFIDFPLPFASLRERLTDLYGAADEVSGALLWADTVTSIFLLKDSSSVIIADTAMEAACTDMERIEEKEKDAERGFLSTLWKKYGDPVGRISQKTYISRAALVGIPVVAMFTFTWLRPELFTGDANIYIITFMILGTLGFISLISLAIRRLSDIGLSHLYYWAFFGLLFVGNQAGAKLLDNELLATRIVGIIFFLAVFLLSFIPGQNRKNKYGPVPK